MTMLQFRPPSYQRPSASEYAQQWGQGLNNVGQSFAQLMQLQQQRAEKEKADRLAALGLGIQAQDKGLDPGALLDYYRTGQLPQSSPSMSPSYGSSLMPSMQPGQGQMASAGMPDTGYGEARVSPTIQAW